ncbi:RecQ family ATP-dependent DNA helicase [Kineosporia sp. NBRC 101677]|uniref:RecQ family ATP-dependent DNA helicase n=1 Tax=Kineosporia sp. NBRC 101677 TaxID=3032197 RepID=UPI002556C26A|nr:RecQ family ATP-dependent DNA helicase [Kineosporia sp. NBRC 101677]
MTTTPTATRSSEVRARAEEALRGLVGSPQAQLHEDQWVAIEALVVDHRRALVVQRTGWGKSAVYFVATALLRAAGAGPTIIISPLLALMRNQIAAAERAGIRAVTVNSSNAEEWAEVYRAIEAGEVDVLLVSPERLNNPDFRERALPRLTAATGLVVIDEAHCVSDWGHDFRPDYRRIRTLLAELPAGIPVLATTATANQRVTSDVAEQLSVTGTSTLDDVLVLRGTLDRASLHLAVVELANPAQRLAWLAENLRTLPGSGIIYCLTVAATEQVAEHLRAAGYEVAAYSGQTEETQRRAAEADLLGNRVKALVATSALGMGFDKPDLGFVIHLGAPPSPIAYYQQVGRAGRGLSQATVVLLPGREDREVWNYFAGLAFPAEHQVRATLEALADREGAMSTQLLETRVDLSRTRLDMMLKVLDVDGAVQRVRGGWVSTGRPWQYDEDRYERVRAARRAEEQSMLDYVHTTGCRMQFLRRTLDDDAAAPCGRCDRCGGVQLDVNVAESDVQSAGEVLDRPGVPVEARKQWPNGLAELGLSLKGRIAPAEQAGPGRAIAGVTDLGWGAQLRELFAPDTPDGEVPVPLRHAIVAVLDHWEMPERPQCIVVIESLSRPHLVRHLAEGLSKYLRLPIAARLVPDPSIPPDEGTANSAQRVLAVANRYTLVPVEGAPGLEGQPVLLIDDRTVTGWTLTVVARQLRKAGASAVYPLVLATN